MSILFVNPKGILCVTIVLFNRQLFTMIDIVPVFDGYDVNGNIINLNDWSWSY